ncbi:heterokaryon incompatibility protein-domain-containing protein [Podospora didyma]|uniref:Heterokaryon incompatibility protein-domain-containing protein n=1 Tax=Podospora didyma TaxID=330526 RepID=A0AAE0NUG2_9PEZI|nr:heterokaryon incompatibility protein-domain-containing protein [Podospora didyma]
MASSTFASTVTITTMAPTATMSSTSLASTSASTLGSSSSSSSSSSTSTLFLRPTLARHVRRVSLLQLVSQRFLNTPADKDDQRQLVENQDSQDIPLKQPKNQRGKQQHDKHQKQQKQLQRPVTPELCCTSKNEHQQRQCRGCDGIFELLRWGELKRRQASDFQGTSYSSMIHNNYRELDQCCANKPGSDKSGCDTCRIVRRGFLLDQITGRDAKSLTDEEKQYPISATLILRPTGDSLCISIDSPAARLFETTLLITTDAPQKTTAASDPTRDGRRLYTNFNELRETVRGCLDNHECSSKHRWSDQNPSWLLKILPNKHVQLVEAKGPLVEYVVLSYSWGDPTTMPKEEWARIKAARTYTTPKGRPVPERMNPFHPSALPETMQDAIVMSSHLGFEYIWIDSVCIPKGTNWDDEASLMHQVYGNAAFTLVACSSTKATDPLLGSRLAWQHRNKPCKMREKWWLHNTQMSMDEVRVGAPVSQRSWTLQEERLSPRILYWANQRWYWSCPERRVVELSDIGIQHPAPTNQHEAWSLPQRYLEACRKGDQWELHHEWLDMVEHYTRRDLVERKDRFLAISGLAVRFYNAKAESGKTRVTEEYLAGLWKDDFARQLAWSVAKAPTSEKNLRDIAPSWSWASLPLCVPAKTKLAFVPSPQFRVYSASESVQAPGSTTEWCVAECAKLLTDSREMGREVEAQGRMVKSVVVEGRFRRFVSQNAQKSSWKDIERTRGDGRVVYHFEPGLNIYARNLEDGRVLTKDAHGGEIIGQLDYIPPSCDQDDVTRIGDYLPDGAEKDLICLELGGGRPRTKDLLSSKYRLPSPVPEDCYNPRPPRLMEKLPAEIRLVIWEYCHISFIHVLRPHRNLEKRITTPNEANRRAIYRHKLMKLDPRVVLSREAKYVADRQHPGLTNKMRELWAEWEEVLEDGWDSEEGREGRLDDAVGQHNELINFFAGNCNSNGHRPSDDLIYMASAKKGWKRFFRRGATNNRVNQVIRKGVPYTILMLEYLTPSLGGSTSKVQRLAIRAEDGSLAGLYNCLVADEDTTSEERLNRSSLRAVLQGWENPKLFMLVVDIPGTVRRHVQRLLVREMKRRNADNRTGFVEFEKARRICEAFLKDKKRNPWRVVGDVESIDLDYAFVAELSKLLKGFFEEIGKPTVEVKMVVDLNRGWGYGS